MRNLSRRRNVGANSNAGFELNFLKLFYLVLICGIILNLALPAVSNSETLTSALGLWDNSSPTLLNQPLPVACDTVVTKTNDDGSCGTLRKALEAAGNGPNKVVTFNLAAGTPITLVGSGLTVPPGVSINGGTCTVDGSPIVINGNGLISDGLTLSGSNIITGVRVGGFKGRQIKTSANGGGNKLYCVAANNSLAGILPPPDPIVIAPPLDTTITTDFFNETAFLYTGPNAIQTGVASGTITRTRAAVLRGKVLNSQSQPLANIKVTILSHPEYGQTLSRIDGMFDMAVNGGSLLTIVYSKNGYLSVQRQVNVPWRDFVNVPDVVMTQLDPAVTNVNLGALPSMTVVRGSTITDSSGTRRATLLVSPGTTATMTLPGGGTQLITNLNIRATEVTVGANGPAAMPGTLPSNSGYTYATNWGIDQAQAANALRVDFNQPLIQYLENFLHFTIGQPVPAGYYDGVQGVWVPGKDGRVVNILSINNGLAELDTTGNGTADNGTALMPAVTTAERQQLATLYSPGQSLWRVPLAHFSWWDFNWPFGPGNGAQAPNNPQGGPETSVVDDPQKRCASIVECQNQILGEELGITGTPFTLNYQSDRVPGRQTAYTIKIPVTGASVPATLKRIDLEIYVAGQAIKQSIVNTTTNQTYSFTWDGKDAYGRVLQGVQKLKYRIGYVYNGVYLTPSERPGGAYDALFGHFSYFGSPATGDLTRQEVTLWQEGSTPIGAWDNRPLGLSGWSLNVQHVYDPIGNVVYRGDGSRQSAKLINSRVITTVAGTGGAGFNGDGGPANQALLNSPAGIVLAADGSLYISDRNNQRIRKVSPDGIISTIAGTGVNGFSGDGGPATQAQLSTPRGLALGSDGSIYFIDSGGTRIRHIGLDGIISTIAGNGTNNSYSGDDGLAINAGFCDAGAIAVGPDNSIYFTDCLNNNGNAAVIRRIAPDGFVTVVIGGTYWWNDGDNIPAAQAGFAAPRGISVGPDGAIYFCHYFPNRWVRKVGANGYITTPAYLDAYQAVVGPDGNLYLATNGFIQMMDQSGITQSIAGNGVIGYSGDGGPALQASLYQPDSIAISPDGIIYFEDSLNNAIRKLYPAIPGFSLNDFIVSSEDGSEAYIFNATGKHKSTRDTTTGAIIYQFGYDSAGRLITVTDVDGLVTTIQRDANGNPTAIVGPFGQTTTLTTNANGYLSTLANPAGETYQMGYTTNGLLTSFTDPRLNSSTFTYDTVGRLTKDQNAAGGFLALGRVDTSSSYTITISTAMSYTTGYNISNNTLGAELRNNTNPSGLQYQSGKGTDGTRTSYAPDGSSTATTLGPDPRWGMQAPLSSSSVITAAPGLVASTSTARTVTLTNPNDPFSLATQTATVTINNRAYIQTYNGTTRTFTNKSPQNRQSTTVINAQGRVTSAQVTGLDPTTYSYDPQGRLINVTGSSGATARPTTFNYYNNPGATNNGYLQTITDPLSRIVNFAYDNAGRVISQTLPGTRTINYGYDSKGNLTSLTPPGKPAHSFTYNGVDLPLTYTAPAVPGGGTNQTSYNYNLDKQLTGITFPDGATLAQGYDSGGRLSSVTTAAKAVNYSYDPTTGQLIGVNVANNGPQLTYSYNGSLLAGETYNGPIAGSVSQTYDNNFWVTSQKVNGGNTVNFTYDNDGLLTGAGALTLNRNSQNGLVTGSSLGTINTALTYNSFGELIGYTATKGATTVYSTTYTRDKLGRITQKVETIGGVTDTYNYLYDTAGRLYQVQKNSVLIATYTYDANGNRLSGPGATGTYDAQDRLLTYGANTYTYNPRGDLLTKVNGANTTQYNYDVESNLISATLPGGNQISYVIDGQNRRIGKKVNGTLVQGFLFQDGLRPVAELDGSNNLVSRFVYASGSNVPSYMVKGGVTYRLLTDHLGSVRLAVNTTDGTIAQRMDYDEYGNVLNDSQPGFQPFGFAGGLYDRDTKLTRFGARDYDAEVGRWTTKDPIGFEGEDTNLYNYIEADPANSLDLSGTRRAKWPEIACLLLGLCNINHPYTPNSDPSSHEQQSPNNSSEEESGEWKPKNSREEKPKTMCPVEQNRAQQPSPPPQNDNLQKVPDLPSSPFRGLYPLFIFPGQTVNPVIFPSGQA